MDTTDIIRRIEKELGMSQTYQVTTFEGIRENADGSWKEITLELLDAGKDAAHRRYVAVVDIEDGERIIEGSTAPTVDEALSYVGAQLG
jgi:stalled ribosome rescue protein Dom34